MPDVTLFDIMKGVRQSWAAAGSTVTDVVPTSRLYFKRVAEGTAYPCGTFSFKDVSAYFGGTEYFSGRIYVKSTQVTFTLYLLASADTNAAFVTAVNNAFGWGSASPAAVWTIPNATVLGAMPETEDPDLTEERIDGVDIVKYSTTFTLKMEADRGP